MGKRTKFQQKELAQMVLLAKPARPTTTAEPQQAEGEAAGADGVPTQLPSAAVHPTDSVRLESVAYSEASAPSEQLTPLEQSVILALCLDIANSNARDGLTAEEMVPYVERVLQTPANWMVYSTALLERSWLDFESPYGRERAVLQLQVRHPSWLVTLSSLNSCLRAAYLCVGLTEAKGYMHGAVVWQALVDQHGTRLTLTQASSDVVADSAPAQERLEVRVAAELCVM